MDKNYKEYTDVIKDLHVFETVKTRLKQCHVEVSGVMVSIANKICVITTCVVLSTCGYFKLQLQSLAYWLRKLFFFCKRCVDELAKVC